MPNSRGMVAQGKLLTDICLLSPSNIVWYWPRGSDVLWLGKLR